jgi:flagellar FliL protein
MLFEQFRLRKKLALLVFVYAGVFVFLAMIGSFMAYDWIAADQVAGDAKQFYRLPRIEISVPDTNGALHFTRIGINLEIEEKNVARFEDYAPRVSDRLIHYFEQTDAETIGKANTSHRLRRNLLEEINDASKPVQVSDLVFREFVVR